MSFVVDNKSQVGQFVSERNRARQFDFLHTSFVVSEHTAGLEIDHEFVSTLNAYATRYLSPQPGRYRRHYNVRVGQHQPSDWSLVHDEMDEFIDVLHRQWAHFSPTQAAAYALWGVNHIHPFCDGNGRTARSLCYYVLCKKLGHWLPGSVTVLELIRTDHRTHHCEILQRMHDARVRPNMITDLAEMTSLIDQLTLIQIQSHHQETIERERQEQEAAERSRIEREAEVARCAAAAKANALADEAMEAAAQAISAAQHDVHSDVENRDEA